MIIKSSKTAFWQKSLFLYIQLSSCLCWWWGHVVWQTSALRWRLHSSVKGRRRTRHSHGASLNITIPEFLRWPNREWWPCPPVHVPNDILHFQYIYLVPCASCQKLVRAESFSYANTSSSFSSSPAPIKGSNVMERAQKTGSANKLIRPTVTWSCATAKGTKMPNDLSAVRISKQWIGFSGWRLLVKCEILPFDVNEMRSATADHIEGAEQPLTKLKTITSNLVEGKIVEADRNHNLI